jgi:hypothetical protein
MSDDPSVSEEPRGPDDLPDLVGDQAPESAEPVEPVEPADEADTPMLPDPGAPGI